MKEEMSNTSLRGVIVLLVIFILWVVISNSKNTYEIKSYNKKIIDSLTISQEELRHRSDSIRDENFMLETEVNRYRIALEMLESEDYKCASEFNKRLSMTE